MSVFKNDEYMVRMLLSCTALSYMHTTQLITGKIVRYPLREFLLLAIDGRCILGVNLKDGRGLYRCWRAGVKARPCFTTLSPGYEPRMRFKRSGRKQELFTETSAFAVVYTDSCENSSSQRSQTDLLLTPLHSSAITVRFIFILQRVSNMRPPRY